LKDTESSCRALVQRMAQLQLSVREDGLDSLVDKLQGAFSQATDSAQQISDLRNDMEMERNKLRGGQKEDGCVIIFLLLPAVVCFIIRNEELKTPA
jgi:hypothetical protein